MSEKRLSYAEYSRLYFDGAIDTSASYIIEGDAEIKNGAPMSLLGVTVCGSVKVLADAFDTLIVKCKITGDVVCGSSSAVIKDCEAKNIILSSAGLKRIAPSDDQKMFTFVVGKDK